ncbi:MAG: aromatic hydrocarbon degradation protein [Arcobacter sp.]|nr:MAG: aromatic hydrocarbon degradation protein [Arcobacter sp.]
MIKKIGILSLVVATTLTASGWRIPEQSVNGTALAGAYVANAHGADAAYYNPANMAFMDQGSYFEGSLTYIHLTAIDYDGVDSRSTTPTTPFSTSSKKENFVLPAFHYVGEAHGDYRFGISFTLPGGLSKRWEDGSTSTLVSKEFTLEVFELNPVMSYKVAESFAIAAGLRLVYSKGTVKSSGTVVVGAPLTSDVSRDMEGDDIALGVNVAASYKPMDNWTLSATYRSKIDLEEKGTATLSSTSVPGFPPSGLPAGSYSGDAGVTVPLPAIFALATAYTINNTTVELEFDRTFWGDYNDLDFTYPAPFQVHPVLKSAFDDPKARNWNHANAYRIGVTHIFNKKWTGMLGYAYDETGAPTNTIGYELPDSDANMYSFGARYNYNDQMSVGIAGLYNDKKEVTTSGDNEAQGTFSNAAAYLLTIGVGYKF